MTFSIKFPAVEMNQEYISAHLGSSGRPTALMGCGSPDSPQGCWPKCIFDIGVGRGGGGVQNDIKCFDRGRGVRKSLGPPKLSEPLLPPPSLRHCIYVII